jgi:hypothetical protein
MRISPWNAPWPFSSGDPFHADATIGEPTSVSRWSLGESLGVQTGDSAFQAGKDEGHYATRGQLATLANEE